jgi:hypothetical protein
MKKTIHADRGGEIHEIEVLYGEYQATLHVLVVIPPYERPTVIVCSPQLEPQRIPMFMGMGEPEVTASEELPPDNPEAGPVVFKTGHGPPEAQPRKQVVVESAGVKKGYRQFKVREWRNHFGQEVTIGELIYDLPGLQGLAREGADVTIRWPTGGPPPAETEPGP